MTFSEPYEKRHEIMLMDEWVKRFHGKAVLETLFTKKEMELFPGKANAGSLAGRYIIKKLLFKQLQYNGDFREIEILNDDFGKPILCLSGRVKDYCQNRKVENICCSISHSRKRVVGMLIFEK